MRKITNEELREILKRHQRWLEESEGCSEEDRANLSGADLRGADLSGADLSGADLSMAYMSRADMSRANLRGADLSGADLGWADLSRAYMSRADMSRADMSRADLRGADLSGADLSRAYMRWADLGGADLGWADLRWADLSGANLSGAKNVPFIPMSCPDTGDFTAWKKCRGLIVMLEIPEDARRLSATGRKCRADKAKVVRIENKDGTEAKESAVSSDYDSSFIYKVGEIVQVKDFCENRWNECSEGIHFFINRQEAVEYQ